MGDLLAKEKPGFSEIVLDIKTLDLENPVSQQFLMCSRE
jgi:hypothetical protein